MALWTTVGRVGAAPEIPVLLLGLARAGVIGYWAAPLFLLGGVLPFVVPGMWAVPTAAVTALPGIVLGLIIVRRGARSVVAAEAAPCRKPAPV